MRDAHHHGFHDRGYLPHLKREGADYFVTFRLADSLPGEVLEHLEAELAALCFADGLAPQAAEAERRAERRRRIESLRDQGSGSCWLRQPAIAQLVASALQHFHGARYHLEAWVVMPNHVHALLRPVSPHPLSAILKTWKQYTSIRVKPLLDLPPGRFWQPEAYDHWVRDDVERPRIIRYIHRNPVKAGLCTRPEDWPWSGARSADFQSAYEQRPEAG